jgi:hypothetical protein
MPQDALLRETDATLAGGCAHRVTSAYASMAPVSSQVLRVSRRSVAEQLRVKWVWVGPFDWVGSSAIIGCDRWSTVRVLIGILH